MIKESSIKAVYIDLKEILQIIPISKTSIYRLSANGAFPKSYRLSERRVAWLRRDVEKWISTRE